MAYWHVRSKWFSTDYIRNESNRFHSSGDNSSKYYIDTVQLHPQAAF
jgi:hypothetical protein